MKCVLHPSVVAEEPIVLLTDSMLVFSLGEVLDRLLVMPIAHFFLYSAVEFLGKELPLSVLLSLLRLGGLPADWLQ